MTTIRSLENTVAPILVLDSPVTAANDAQDFVSATHDTGATRVLLHDTHLPADFFALLARFVGKFIQKLINYRLLVAGVFAPARMQEGSHFAAHLDEASAGRQFRSFDSEA